MYCSHCEKSTIVNTKELHKCPVCNSRLRVEAEDLLGDRPTRFVPEIRKPQLEMAQYVTKSILNSERVILEAGVGTGKSYAYGIPALSGDGRTVISTGTIALQNQILDKDFPKLVDTLGEFGHRPRYAIAQGRRNYVCGLAVINENPAVARGQARDRGSHAGGAGLQSGNRRAGPENPGGLSQRFIDFAVRAATEGHLETGAWTNYGPDLPVQHGEWSAEECVGKTCPYFGSCGFIRAKQLVEHANVVVANHAIVGVDIALTRQNDDGTYGPLLGKYDRLIIDEAHKAIPYFRNAFASEVSSSAFNKVLTKAGNAGVSGYNGRHHLEAVSALARVFRELPEPDKNQYRLVEASDLNSRLSERVEEFKKACTAVMSPMNATLMLYLGKIENNEQLTQSQWKEYRVLNRLNKRTTDILSTLGALTKDQAEEVVTYVKDTPRGKVLCSSPVHIGGKLNSSLYSRLRTLVLTSGTLQVGGKFDYIKSQFGLRETDHEKQFDSPFDYKTQAALYLPVGMPAPPRFGTQGGAAQRYTKPTVNTILNLAELTSGATLVLFTSRYEMDLVFDDLKLRRNAGMHKFNVLRQERNQSPALTLARYKRAEETGTPSILLGLRSFFEGISLEKDYLKSVVITKLPFPMMNDPIYKALCDRAGERAFQQVTLPEMIRDVQQAAGRLIRTAQDYGVCTILDPRIHTKNYGKMVVESLPFVQRTTDFNKLKKWFVGKENAKS